MNGRCFFWIFLFCLVFPVKAILQEPGEAHIAHPPVGLLEDPSPLELSLTASIKSLKKETNDSTYLESTLAFADRSQPKDSIELLVRARGNSRRSNCYFAPLKLKFRTSDIRGTLYEGHKELKLVLPCLIGSLSDDYVLKEYLAYKLFEVVSPYYYQTRLAHVEFIELKGRRERSHDLMGFLIEDHSTLAGRLDGKRMRKNLPPQMQDPRASIINNLFQFAIGNTDFSLRKQHNQRLYYIQGKYVSIPYDFDMAGLVNAPYATVSNVQTLDYQPSSVRERAYKGFLRDTVLMQQVRQEFLDARPGIMEELEALQPYFKDRGQYEEAQKYLQGFFDILGDDRKFEREILRRMRE